MSDSADIAALPTTMRVVGQDDYCEPEQLTVREQPTPTPGNGQVLLQVQAVSLNPADWHYVVGQPYIARIEFGLRKPKSTIPGMDVAGRVVAVGSNVTQLKVGDEVFGYGSNCLAEYVALAEEQLVLRPKEVTAVEASTVGVAAFTALQGLRDKGSLGEGQHVLITGASGGVGNFAIQIAKSLGAEVTAVCQTKYIEMVRSLGADHVIDYTTDDFTVTGLPDGKGPYDVFLDNVGNRSLSDSRRVLNESGRYIMVSGPKAAAFGPIPRLIRALATSLFSSQKTISFVAKDTPEDLAILRDMLASGRLTPIIDQTYPMEEANIALARIGEGHTAGKIVIVP